MTNKEREMSKKFDAWDFLANSPAADAETVNAYNEAVAAEWAAEEELWAAEKAYYDIVGRDTTANTNAAWDRYQKAKQAWFAACERLREL
jgi:ssDNA-binding replication factor A large subunit